MKIMKTATLNQIIKKYKKDNGNEIISLEKYILDNEDETWLDPANLLVMRDLICEQCNMKMHCSIDDSPYEPYYCFTKENVLAIITNLSLMVKDIYSINLKH